jgi:hypothetical protein
VRSALIRSLDRLPLQHNSAEHDWSRIGGGEEQPTVPIPVAKKRIVILGGGFAGMTTAQCLEKELEKDLSVRVTLVSESNALLFTPMLRLSS